MPFWNLTEFQNLFLPSSRKKSCWRDSHSPLNYTSKFFSIKVPLTCTFTMFIRKMSWSPKLCQISVYRPGLQNGLKAIPVSKEHVVLELKLNFFVVLLSFKEISYKFHCQQSKGDLQTLLFSFEKWNRSERWWLKQHQTEVQRPGALSGLLSSGTVALSALLPTLPFLPDFQNVF